MGISKFANRMLDCGIDPGDIKGDGCVHRFATWGDKAGQTSGAYWHNGRFGWFQDWRTMPAPEIVAGELSAEDKETLNRSFNGAGGRTRDEVVEDFRRIYDEADADISDHPYAIKKGITAVLNVRQHDGRLLIPVFGIADGRVCGLQYIDGEGNKKFLVGTKKKGCVFGIQSTNGSKETVICEGFATGVAIHKATGHAVGVAFDAGNLLPVAEAMCEKTRRQSIIIAGDNDKWKVASGDKNTGEAAAIAAGDATGARVIVPAFTSPNGKATTDFDDLLAAEGVEAVVSQIAAARVTLRFAIKQMMELDSIDRGTERNRIAKEYGISKKVIDEYTEDQEPAHADDFSIVEELDPATDPVDGEVLFCQIARTISERVILPPKTAEAIAAWVFLSYCYDNFNIMPFLGITSPTKRCGKTTLIEVLDAVCYRSLSASNLSSAAIFRTIELYQPTLLVDEADTYLINNDEMRGILNSGHVRSQAHVVRLAAVGDSFEPKKFSTWAPRVIGMIGDLPETIQDRSIVITLRRKLAGERVKKTAIDFKAQCADIRRRCLRWAADNEDRLRTIKVAVPASGNDRADDNWKPLLTVAAVIGGGCPGAISAAMGELVPESRDDAAISIKLLIDIQEIFKTIGGDTFGKLNPGEILSEKLVELLLAVEESPWSDMGHGKSLTQNRLGGCLRQFGIHSTKLRFAEGAKGTKQGYRRGMFDETFARYLYSRTPFSGFETEQTEQTNKNGDLHQKANGTRPSHETEQTEQTEQTNKNGDLHQDNYNPLNLKKSSTCSTCSTSKSSAVPLQNSDNLLNLKKSSTCSTSNPKKGLQENNNQPGGNGGWEYNTEW